MVKPTGPLAGIKVIDIATVVLGPYASQVLGDMGADVIKVETTAGDTTRYIGPSRTKGMGSYFATLNRNKRSLAIDLKKPTAMKALLTLIDSADVFVHNMRIGAAARLGLDYESLSIRNPRLVYACASGFRKGSSLQEFPAYDDLIQGLSGIASLNAGPDGAPRYFPMVVVDKLTGSNLASMIGMALFHRERTGEGQEVHVPHAGNDLLVPRWSSISGTAYFNEPEKGVGYPRVLVAASPSLPDQGRFYQRHRRQLTRNGAKLFESMGVPHLDRRSPVHEHARPHREYLRMDARWPRTLAEGMKARTTDEWIAELRPADIPCGRAGTLADLFDDPYLKETNFFEEVDHPVEGKALTTAVPARFSKSPPNTTRPWPTLGEHNREILREAGCSEVEIDSILS